MLNLSLLWTKGSQSRVWGPLRGHLKLLTHKIQRNMQILQSSDHLSSCFGEFYDYFDIFTQN